MCSVTRFTLVACTAAIVAAISSACGLELDGSNASLDDGGGVAPVDGSMGADDASYEAAIGADAAPDDAALHLDADAEGGSTGDAGRDGCATAVENCENGVDDNCDGLVDCADPMCAAFECVASAPSGWNGYFRVATGTAPSTPAPCPAGGAATTLYEGPAGPAECTGCGCDPVAGAACSPASIECAAGSTTCGGNGVNGVDWTSSLDNGACDMPTNLLGTSTSLSCEISRPVAVSATGTCTPTGGELVATPPFATQVDVCGAAMAGGGGCASGNVCVPKSGAPYSSSVCVERGGATSCPSGWATGYETYTGASDTRGCSACACGGPNTTCSAGSYTFFDLDQCMGDGTDGTTAPITVATSTCTDVSVLLDQGSWSARATLPTPSGTCSPSGGSPYGSVSPAGQMTICCQ